MEKILGIGLPRKLHEKSVILCARLWTELDIVPVILDESGITDDANNAAVVHFRGKRLDEQADSGARKCIRYPPHLEFYRCPPHYTCIDYDLFLRFFGPNNLPFLQVGLYGSVEVDSGFRVRIADVSRFEHTVRPKTWSAVQHYAADLKKRHVKIAFFSATPQGGGVALMRHALIRLAN